MARLVQSGRYAIVADRCARGFFWLEQVATRRGWWARLIHGRTIRYQRHPALGPFRFVDELKRVDRLLAKHRRTRR